MLGPTTNFNSGRKMEPQEKLVGGSSPMLRWFFRKTMWRSWTLWFYYGLKLKESKKWRWQGESPSSEGSRPPRSESAGSSDPTTILYSGKVNQLDKSALTSLAGFLGPPVKLVVGSSPRLT